MFAIRRNIARSPGKFHYSNNFTYNNLLIDNCDYNKKFQSIEDQQEIINTINRAEFTKSMININTSTNDTMNNKIINEIKKINKSLENIEKRLEKLEKISGCYCYCYR